MGVILVSAPEQWRDTQSPSGPTNLELTMTSLIARFVKNESGATAIEYGLIASLIGVAIIGALRATGTKLNGTFTNVQNQL